MPKESAPIRTNPTTMATMLRNIVTSNVCEREDGSEHNRRQNIRQGIYFYKAICLCLLHRRHRQQASIIVLEQERKWQTLHYFSIIESFWLFTLRGSLPLVFRV